MNGCTGATREAPPIKGWIECTFLDWPGRVSGVVFLPGCNFRCRYCHNHRLVLEPESFEEIRLETVLRHYRGRREWIDGIVVSGGEPTIHAGLPAFVEQIRREGWPIKLDTNGSNPGMIELLLQEELVDHVAMDVKAPPGSASYGSLAGVPVDSAAIGRSIELILSWGVAHTFRTTVSPDWFDEYDLAAVASALSGASTWRIQNLNPNETLDPDLRGARRFGDEDLARLESLADDILASGRLDRSMRQATRYAC
jgi:pyruvate formate lyase activating enzyme